MPTSCAPSPWTPAAPDPDRQLRTHSAKTRRPVRPGADPCSCHQARQGLLRSVGGSNSKKPLVELDDCGTIERAGPSAVAVRRLYGGFDLEAPEICLQRGDSWMFGPEAAYERGGDVKDVVFPCGQTIGDDGDTINLYYGASDSSIALATGSIRSSLAWLDSNSGATEGATRQRDRGRGARIG